MKKIIKYILLSVCVIGMNKSSAMSKTSYMGHKKFSNQTFQGNVQILGGLTANNIKAPDGISITGGTKLVDSVIGSATITGPLTSKKTTFNKDAKITGSTSTTDTIFNGTVKIIGATEVSKTTFNDTVKITGATTANIAIFKKLLAMTGSLSGTAIQAPEGIKVTGAVDLIHSVISNAQITGQLTADKTTFTGEIKITVPKKSKSLKIELTDTKAKNITVIIEEDIIPRVILKGNTIVDGDITFKNGKGKVTIEDNAQHTGKVIEK